MRIFKNRWFAKFAKDEGISDEKLCKAVKDAENGLGDKAFFVYGFPKNAQDNITKADVKEYKALAKITFALCDEKLGKLIQTGAFKAVTCYE